MRSLGSGTTTARSPYSDLYVHDGSQLRLEGGDADRVRSHELAGVTFWAGNVNSQELHDSSTGLSSRARLESTGLLSARHALALANREAKILRRGLIRVHCDLTPRASRASRPRRWAAELGSPSRCSSSGLAKEGGAEPAGAG